MIDVTLKCDEKAERVAQASAAAAHAEPAAQPPANPYVEPPAAQPPANPSVEPPAKRVKFAEPIAIVAPVGPTFADFSDEEETRNDEDHVVDLESSDVEGLEWADGSSDVECIIQHMVCNCPECMLAVPPTAPGGQTRATQEGRGRQ